MLEFNRRIGGHQAIQVSINRSIALNRKERILYMAQTLSNEPLGQWDASQLLSPLFLSLLAHLLVTLLLSHCLCDRDCKSYIEMQDSATAFPFPIHLFIQISTNPVIYHRNGKFYSTFCILGILLPLSRCGSIEFTTNSHFTFG